VPCHLDFRDVAAGSYDFYHRISIPAYARTTMMTVRRFQKRNVINVIYIQNDACSLPKRVNKWLYFKYLLTRQQMVFHLFFTLTVPIRSSVLFPTLCGSINTKSMIYTYHARFMLKEVAEKSQIFFRDTLLPKCLSYVKYCRRDRWWQMTPSPSDQSPFQVWVFLIIKSLFMTSMKKKRELWSWMLEMSFTVS
jgi:hypothetical protein